MNRESPGGVKPNTAPRAVILERVLLSQAESRGTKATACGAFTQPDGSLLWIPVFFDSDGVGRR